MSQCLRAGQDPGKSLTSSSVHSKEKIQEQQWCCGISLWQAVSHQGTHGDTAQGAEGAELGLAGQGPSVPLQAAGQALPRSIMNQPGLQMASPGHTTANSIHIIVLNCLDFYIFYKKKPCVHIRELTF